MTELKPSNPKDAVGSSKLPLHLAPATAVAMMSLGLLDGMLKYGLVNWRTAGVRASIYVDACKRHLDKWFNGEDCDPESGLPHMAHALACLAIIVDAGACDGLVDDRPFPCDLTSFYVALTPHVERLKAMHKGRAPKHWYLRDAQPDSAAGGHP